jgi:hypothetical protein
MVDRAKNSGDWYALELHYVRSFPVNGTVCQEFQLFIVPLATGAFELTIFCSKKGMPSDSRVWMGDAEGNTRFTVSDKPLIPLSVPLLSFATDVFVSCYQWLARNQNGTALSAYVIALLGVGFADGMLLRHSPTAVSTHLLRKSLVQRAIALCRFLAETEWFCSTSNAARCLSWVSAPECSSFECLCGALCAFPSLNAHNAQTVHNAHTVHRARCVGVVQRRHVHPCVQATAECQARTTVSSCLALLLLHPLPTTPTHCCCY